MSNTGRAGSREADGRLHRTLLVADACNALLTGVTLRPPSRWAAHFAEAWLPRLQAGNVGLQVLSIGHDRHLPSELAARQALRMLAAARRIADAHPESVRVCATRDDLDRTVETGRLALVLAIDGCEAVGQDLALLSLFHRLGVRMASVYRSATTLAPAGPTGEWSGNRLTDAAAATVEEMGRLGVLLDLSGLTASAVDHALELTRRPVVASHTAAAALRTHRRNLSDRHLRAIAETGGVACVSFYGAALHPRDFSLDRLGDHLEHLAATAGVDHVGLGSAFTREVLPDVLPAWTRDHVMARLRGCDAHVPGLEDPTGLPSVTDLLVRRGWTDDDIRKVMGENLRRVLTTVL